MSLRLLALLTSLACLALPAPPAGAQSGLALAAGFRIERIATVPRARELAVAPNGDLIAGTWSDEVYVVPDATGAAAAPQLYLRIADAPLNAVALGDGTLYIGGQFGIYAVPYTPGDRRARERPHKLAAVRTAGGARDHLSVSLAFAAGRLYASVGSSCNACDPELDPTRATIDEIDLHTGALRVLARGARNAVALAVNPATGSLWAGIAGQDELAHGHPYEIFDPVTAHAGPVDYGWPTCYENRRPTANRDCSVVTPARVVFPAYTTPIGAAFYPLLPTGAYAFPAAYRGGAFVTLHGSWHLPLVAPLLAFVPLHGDEPLAAVNWSDPTTQWRPFVDDFQGPLGLRSARPTGIAVGPDGSLFVADDQGGAIYRIRPVR